jgi:dolichyl-phosphate-mannose--protein O-mannosyl transferase
VFVTVLAYGRYVVNYDRPSALFWDEKRVIPSAQRYLNGVFFMELHPPLGKLLVALGERIVRANPRDDLLVGADYFPDIPSGFSFMGYRLIPVLLAWLTAPLVFLVFRQLTHRLVLSVALTLFYIFDNALIVHLRGAMLEAPLLFFVVATLLLFLVTLEWPAGRRRLVVASLGFGATLGLAVATKMLAMVLLLLIPMGVLRLRTRPKRAFAFASLAVMAGLLTWGSVWQIHFALASRVVPSLPNQGYYQASDAYRHLLSEGRNRSLWAFPTMIRDSWRYVWFYNRGVPTLDLCKPGETGSPFYLWPLGARAIDYRWEIADGTAYRYLYLVANPVGWACGLIGVLLVAWLLVRPAILRGSARLKNGFALMTFLGLYVAYMLAVGSIGRVLYLYHYLIPLLLSFFLFGIALMEVHRFLGIELTDARFGRETIALVVAVLLLVAHHVYAPLTYYQPLTDSEFQRRAALRIWDLRCADCGSTVSFWCRQPVAPSPPSVSVLDEPVKGAFVGKRGQ